MDIQSAFFYVFSAVLLFAAFRVITARNPVHAALYLVLAFFQASGVWMLLKAEFLSITLVLVYVGAVMVLLDRKSTRLNSSHSQQSRMPSSA